MEDKQQLNIKNIGKVKKYDNSPELIKRLQDEWLAKGNKVTVVKPTKAKYKEYTGKLLKTNVLEDAHRGKEYRIEHEAFRDYGDGTAIHLS